MISSIETLAPLERLAIQDMSYSRLDTYQSCPAKYFYTYVVKAPRVFGPAAAMGTIVHSVLEKADFESLDLDELKTAFFVEKEVEDPDDQVGGELVNAAMVLLEEFVDRHAGDDFDILGREKDFEMVIGSCLYRGYIDRIDRERDGSVRVVDYKTGKWEVPQKHIHSNLQLGLYALYAEQEYPDLRPVRGELYYLRSGKRKAHTYSAEELVDIRGRILELNHEIIARAGGSGFPHTKNTNTCKRLCDFGKNGTCRYGANVIRNSYY